MLFAYEHRHILKFAAGVKNPVNSTGKDKPRNLLGVRAVVHLEPLNQKAPDSGFPIPYNGFDFIPYRVIAPLVKAHPERIIQLLGAVDVIFVLDVPP